MLGLTGLGLVWFGLIVDRHPSTTFWMACESASCWITTSV